jgi:hypothetical protein
MQDLLMGEQDVAWYAAGAVHDQRPHPVREVISRHLRLMAKADLVAWGGSSRQVRDLPGLMRLRGGSE